MGHACWEGVGGGWEEVGRELGLGSGGRCTQHGSVETLQRVLGIVLSCTASSPHVCGGASFVLVDGEALCCRCRPPLQLPRGPPSPLDPSPPGPVFVHLAVAPRPETLVSQIGPLVWPALFLHRSQPGLLNSSNFLDSLCPCLSALLRTRPGTRWAAPEESSLVAGPPGGAAGLSGELLNCWPIQLNGDQRLTRLTALQQERAARSVRA
jgi:hypothetical protein